MLDSLRVGQKSFPLRKEMVFHMAFTNHLELLAFKRIAATPAFAIITVLGAEDAARFITASAIDLDQSVNCRRSGYNLGSWRERHASD